MGTQKTKVGSLDLDFNFDFQPGADQSLAEIINC